MFGPRWVAEGNYAQMCAMTELRRRRYRIDTKITAEKLGASARLSDPLNEILYAPCPMFGLLSSGKIPVHEPRKMTEHDVENTQRSKNDNR